MHISRKKPHVQGASVSATQDGKQYNLPLRRGFYHVCLKQTVDRGYFETSNVHREPWSDPPPVILPHYTWINGVHAALGLCE